MASPTTIRSGVITSRIETREASRSSSCMATRLPTSRWTSASTFSSGSWTSRNMRASGRAAESIDCSLPRTLSSHQRAASGKESSRRVSPVGAQSTTIASHSPDSTWFLSTSRLNSSSPPGGTVSSSAAIRSTPRSISSEPSHSETALQWCSSSSWAWICCARSLRGDLGRLAADLGLQHVGQRMRGVGGDDERLQALRGAAPRRGRGHGRLADPALAGVENRPWTHSLYSTGASGPPPHPTRWRHCRRGRSR